MPPESSAQPPCHWHTGTLVRGYGVASGQALDSPYPAGTISLQAPLFAQQGLDLSGFFGGTLNLAFAGCRWHLSAPDVQVVELLWSDRHPAETFSFWRVQLRRAGSGDAYSALIYWPHPETKRNHHHSPDRLELLAPWIEGLREGDRLEIGLDPRRCRCIRPQALQARLLEAIKFRVLASQESFFAAYRQGSVLMARAFRAELPLLLPAALDLSDGELVEVLERAQFLYGDGIGCDTMTLQSGFR
ncbi:MAG: hypothetical protein ACO289_08445 [Prochlorococcaceae cyanobacterium]